MAELSDADRAAVRAAVAALPPMTDEALADLALLFASAQAERLRGRARPEPAQPAATST